MPREGFSRKRGESVVPLRLGILQVHQKINLTRMDPRPMKPMGFMKRNKKRWIKPTLKTVPIFFECTCYAGAV